MRKVTKEDRWIYLRERLIEAPNKKFINVACDVISRCGDSFTVKDLDYIEKSMKEEGIL